MNHPRRWRIGAVAATIALLGSLASLQAHALALGRVSVQSALGEPLRAEIEIGEINADESATLRTSVAGIDAFKAAGLEYSTALASVKIRLQRRPDGRAYLHLSTSRPINEPFIDLILEARWSSGRIVRDYTMLFDPPNLRQAGNAPPLATPTPPMVSQPASPVATAPYYPPSPPPSRPPPLAKAPAQPALAADKGRDSDSRKITVKTGDIAGKIALQNKPASVSLDQMLVALLRSNPDAFIGGNVNRLKAGAVLDVPGAEQAEAIAPGEATRAIVAQSRDFNEFRRKLAEAAPASRVSGADRQAAGQVQAEVEDRAPAATTPDKLTLSKGAVQSKTAAEEKFARDRQAKETTDRLAELSKNISDLNKLGVLPATPPPPSVASAGTQPPTPGVAVANLGAGALPGASAPTAALSPASASAVAAPPAMAAMPAASAPASAAASPPPAPSLIDELLENPLLLVGGAALLALLLAFGVYRVRQRKNAVAVDSSFLESRLQPDSFFGASGGQRIDTNEASVTGSSMVYSPSQLDAAGDVDPVAEADVYLAYGRDLQAEEILKDAMRVSPTRVAIHAKLMEIYAKRRDTRAFGMMATEAFNLTKGQGVEWVHMAEMGRDLDPANPMYQPGGQPASANAGGVGLAGTAGFASPSMAQSVEPPPESAPAAVDLDLDFALDELAAPAPAAAARFEPTMAMPAVVAPPAGNGMDFSLSTMAMPAPTQPAPLQAVAPDPLTVSKGLNFTTGPVVTTAASPLDSAGGMLEFDLGSLSLELEGPSAEDQKTTASAPASSGMEGPLETKFALAEEFRAIGDLDGARSLAEEVLAQSNGANGALQGKAQAFLNALS